MLLTNKKIGVFMGGVSTEREVSLRSGYAIYNALKQKGYNVVGISINDESFVNSQKTLKQNPRLSTVLPIIDCTPLQMCEVLRKESIEIVFLALHGGYGENGSIQGMLEVLGIPYTGSGVLASALAMDKEMSKKIFQYHNVPVAPFVVLKREEGTKRIEFDLPWVVKPASEGSSIGVSIVREEKNFQKALKVAFSFGARVVVEKFIEGKEIHIGILNDRVLGGVEVRPSLEFYSYEAKYKSGLTEYILPPEIDFEVYKKVQDIALSAHLALGCNGATRVDLIVDSKGCAYVLEVNTIPGMTETSLLPKIAKLAGLDFIGLVEEILKGVIHENE